jgi:LuxR family maltose regulon positive regulatory protein
MPGEYTTLARVYLAQENIEAAHQLLNGMLPLMEEAGRMSRIIEILALHALAYQAQGNLAQALAILEKSLTLAAPEQFVRIYVDEGRPMAQLLRQALNQTAVPDNVSALLKAFAAAVLPAEVRAPPTPTTSPAKFPIEPLSERELDVLHLLPSDLSSREIADELVISVHTARSHIKNIYSKLNVNSREAAVAQARALKLLSS